MVVVYDNVIRTGNRVRSGKTGLNISYVAMKKASEKEICNGDIY
jgi:hypothetical protein